MAGHEYQPEIKTGTGKTKTGKEYTYQFLPAHEAVLKFRLDNPAPNSAIITHCYPEHHLVKAEIFIGDTLVATAHAQGGDGTSIGLLETRAVRRALAFVGYGTTAALAAQDDGNDYMSETVSARFAMETQGVDWRKQLGSGGNNRVGQKRLENGEAGAKAVSPISAAPIVTPIEDILDKPPAPEEGEKPSELSPCCQAELKWINQGGNRLVCVKCLKEYDRNDLAEDEPSSRPEPEVTPNPAATPAPACNLKDITEPMWDGLTRAINDGQVIPETPKGRAACAKLAGEKLLKKKAGKGPATYTATDAGMKAYEQRSEGNGKSRWSNGDTLFPRIEDSDSESTSGMVICKGISFTDKDGIANYRVIHDDDSKSYRVDTTNGALFQEISPEIAEWMQSWKPDNIYMLIDKNLPYLECDWERIRTVTGQDRRVVKAVRVMEPTTT